MSPIGGPAESFEMSKTVSILAAALLTAASVLCSPSAFAGSVTLADGTSLQGNVLLMGTGEARIVVTPVGKPPRGLKISEIRAASFDARPGDTGSRECDGVTWVRAEVGETKKAGSTQFNGTRIDIRDSSDGFHFGRPRRDEALAGDSCCFVFQKLDGDGEIVGRVLPSESTKWMRAGLMICEGLDGDGPTALLSRTADPVAATLISRAVPKEPLTTTIDTKNVPVGLTWLKLIRTKNLIQGFESLDGVRWEPVGERKIIMDDSKGVYIGVAATGNAREGTATFEDLKLMGKRSSPVFPGVVDTRLPDISVTLQDGTVLAGMLESIDAAGMGSIRRTGAPVGAAPLTVPMAQLARAQFAPLTRPQTEKFIASANGMLTRDGDFLEGDVKALTAENVTVSSITFGLTTMERARVFGVIFPPPATPAPSTAGMTQVWLEDGSMIVASHIAIEKDDVVLDEPLLGQFKAPLKDVQSMERREK
jgi:hypothetical protein